MIYRFGNLIGHLYQQLQPVVKNKQNVAARDVHALETANASNQASPAQRFVVVHAR